MANMAGNFQDGVIPGKIQHGPPWWFLDQKNGIEKQLDSLSDMGILSEFIGMTTDSRSFLSFSRHDYFRRILCNRDRKSTRLNSSHVAISYAVFCLKKKNKPSAGMRNEPPTVWWRRPP